MQSHSAICVAVSGQFLMTASGQIGMTANSWTRLLVRRPPMRARVFLDFRNFQLAKTLTGSPA